jgi:hypothetical protein
MKTIWQSILSVMLGFIGGISTMYIKPVFNRTTSVIRAETIRAEHFELVDQDNRRLAYWGTADQERRTQLAFLDDKGTIRARFGTEASKLIKGRPVALSPFSELFDSNGKARLQEILDGSENPVLTMADSNGANRLILGYWNGLDVVGEADHWDKWSLVFRDSAHDWRNYVDIGVTTPLDTHTRTGYALFYDNRDHKFSIEPKSK